MDDVLRDLAHDLGSHQHRVISPNLNGDIGEESNKSKQKKHRNIKESAEVGSERNAQQQGISVTLDVESLKPEGWPYRYSPKLRSRELIRNAFRWLYHERNETIVAVVCHYNVIRSAIGHTIRPENATPICCRLYEDGDLVPAEVVE